MNSYCRSVLVATLALLLTGGAAAEIADTGLTSAEEKEFWYTGQGSMLMPASWWRHLEQPESNDGDLRFFREPEYIDHIGYLTEGEDPDHNPDGYPIGFGDSVNPFTGETWMGHTCAACHSNEMVVNGTPLFITGAPTLASFDEFQKRLIAALQHTYVTDGKFDRFSERVLSGYATTENKQTLRAQLLEVILYLKEFEATNRPSVWGGYGRVDAFGIIYNQTAVKLLGMPENRQDPDAPVSYPYLWGAAQGDYTQWNGVADNTYPVFGPLARNVTEVMGVYGMVDVVPEKWAYKSSVDFTRLKRLEELIVKLRSPVYPDHLLEEENRIDTEAATRGAGLFAAHCSGCHTVVKREDQHKPYKVTLVPLEDVGTEPELLRNSVNAKIDPGMLTGQYEMMTVGPTLTNPSPTFTVAVRIALGAVLNNIGEVLDGPAMMELATKLPGHIKEKGLLQHNPRMHMKARPLNAIWATAPYLHNGSVPNLVELMKHPDDRVGAFFVGCRVYDPVNVGFKMPPVDDMKAAMIDAGFLEPRAASASAALTAYASDSCDINKTSLLVTRDEAWEPTKGDGNQGHPFPALFLTGPTDKEDVRQFLKTI